jgi:hypothetical protein
MSEILEPPPIHPPPPAGLQRWWKPAPAKFAVSPAALAAGVLITVGSFLPWVVVRDASNNIVNVMGNDGGDGTLTLPFGLALLVAGFIPQLVGTVTGRIVSAVAAAAAGLIMLNDYVAFQRTAQGVSNQYQVWVNTGTGLYVILVGVLCGFIAAAISRN